jgi:chromosome segregation protein
MAESTSPAVAAPSAPPVPVAAGSAPAEASTPAAPAAPVVGELAAKPNLRPHFVPPSEVAAAESVVAEPAAAEAAHAEPPSDAAPAAAAAEVDDIAASLAALNRETRAARAARERAESELAKVGDKVTQAEQLAAVRESMKAKDYVAALKALDPDLSVDEAILTLLEQAKATDAQPLSQADIERIALAKVEAHQKAAQAAAEAETKARVDQASASYVGACAAEFQAAAGEFALIGALGVSADKIRDYATECYQRDRSVPSPAETLRHFEAQYESALKRAGYSRAQIAEMKTGAQPTPAAATTPAAPAPAAGAIVGAAASDTGGAPSTPAKPQTLAEKIAARRAAIVQAAQAR